MNSQLCGENSIVVLKFDSADEALRFDSTFDAARHFDLTYNALDMHEGSSSTKPNKLD